MVAGLLGGLAGGAVVSIVIRTIDNYSKEFKKLDNALEQQQTGFKRLTNFLHQTGLGYAALAGATASFAISSVKSFIETERAAQAFDAVLGDLAETMLVDLRQAAKGMASDFALMDAANKALVLGIDKNNLPELLEVARARGKITGRTVTQAFEDISIGIGRQSRLILDNLGIILDLDLAYEEYAKSIGKTKDELDEFEKKQAVTNKVLEESRGIVILMNLQLETTGEKLQRLSAWWQNLKDDVGEATTEFIDVGLAAQEVFKSLVGIETEIKSPSLRQALKEQLVEWQGIEEQVKNANKAVDEYGQRLQSLTKGPFIDVLKKQEELAQAELNLAQLRKQFSQLPGGVAGPFASPEASELRRQIDTQEHIIEKLKDEIEEKQRTVDLAQKKIDLELALREENQQTTDNLLKNLEAELAKGDEIFNNRQLAAAEQKRINDEVVAKEKEINAELTQRERILQNILDLYGKINKIQSKGGFTGGANSGLGGLATRGLSKLPFFQEGGVMPHTGLAFLHKGETVVPAGQGASMIINIESVNGLDPDMVAEALQSKLKRIISI